MIAKKMQDALNKQINAELYSSYLYLSMAAQAESDNLPGSAHWLRAQAEEEMAHAMRFYRFVLGRGGKVGLGPIDAPPGAWGSPLAVFQDVLSHEQKVTRMIHDLADLAEKEADRASAVMLQWFVTEQVEEEANATRIVETLKMIGDSGGGLLALDHQLGKRGKGD